MRVEVDLPNVDDALRRFLRFVVADPYDISYSGATDGFSATIVSSPKQIDLVYFALCIIR